MSPNTATALGVGAIVLWATLASLTALKGPLPPFQTTAIVFTIGGALMVLIAVLRGRAALLRPTPASLALGIYGLFVYHALYFAALSLAPPAEASLITSLWALLTVLLSGLLPGHRLRLAHIAAIARGNDANRDIAIHQGPRQGGEERTGNVARIAGIVVGEENDPGHSKYVSRDRAG